MLATIENGLAELLGVFSGISLTLIIQSMITLIRQMRERQEEEL